MASIATAAAGGGKKRNTDYALKIVQMSEGRFEYHSPDALTVDERYQRGEANRGRLIDNIAKNWNPMLAGVISVAHRHGTHYVYDGHGRVLAARRNGAIRRLPCIVFDTSNVADEALAFLGINCNRKTVTAIDKFNPLVITDDPAAVTLKHLLADHGYEIAETAATGRRVKCVRCLMDWIRSDADLFRAMFPLIAECCDPDPIPHLVVDSLCWIESKLAAIRTADPDFTHSLLSAPWRGRVLKLGTAGIIEAARRAAGATHRSGQGVWGGGVADALNHGVRNKLPLGFRYQLEQG